MIFGNVQTEGYEHLHPVLQKAIKFLKETDFENLEPQKFEIDGDNMFATLMETKSDYHENRRMEAHVKYIDIQFSVSGKEIIGTGVLSDAQKVTEDNLEAKDVIFYDGAANEELLVMEKGSYAILFPIDLHRPNCCTDNTPTAIKKVVVKIKHELLK